MPTQAAIFSTVDTCLYAGDTKAAEKYMLGQLDAKGNWTPAKKQGTLPVTPWYEAK